MAYPLRALKGVIGAAYQTQINPDQGEHSAQDCRTYWANNPGCKIASGYAST
jgi:hypothetical protein